MSKLVQAAAICGVLFSLGHTGMAAGVPQMRLAHLRRGINISDWLAQVGDPAGYSKEHFDRAITPHDLDLIQAMGFDHVRLSVDPRPMFHARQADQMGPEDFQHLDAAVKMILDRGDRWNAARIDAEIGQVAAWAGHWGVPVICNEFGVYRKNAEPKDRAAWLTDVRTALEKRDIGWAMWEYHGGFGVVTSENGQPVPDASTLRALGLTMPSYQSLENQQSQRH